MEKKLIKTGKNNKKNIKNCIKKLSSNTPDSFKYKFIYTAKKKSVEKNTTNFFL